MYPPSSNYMEYSIVVIIQENKNKEETNTLFVCIFNRDLES